MIVVRPSISFFSEKMVSWADSASRLTVDWTDPEVRKKANPSLGITVGIDKVQAACESAQQNPAEENAFRQLRLNQWVMQTSTYVGVYTEELYNLLLRNAREAREIRKSLRSIEKQLAAVGYSEDELSVDVVNNIAFARANMKMNIYDQAVLEGVATSFPQTEEIIENGKVSGMTATDVQKILNLKHAWEFILDRDVVASRSTISPIPLIRTNRTPTCQNRLFHSSFSAKNTTHSITP